MEVQKREAAPLAQSVYSGNMQAANTLNVPAPKPVLDELENRIRACNERAIQTALSLQRHADAVFGPVPESDEKACGEELYDDSAIGRVKSALRDLEATLNQINEQANRNCKLA